MQNKLSLLAIVLSACSLCFSIFVFLETRESLQNNVNPAAAQSRTSITDYAISEEKQNKIVEIAVSEDGFSPSGFHIKLNQFATVSIVNAGEKPHSFVIDELGIDTGLIEPGQTKKFEFGKDIKSAESFKFYSNAEGDDKEKIIGSIMIF